MCRPVISLKGKFPKAWDAHLVGEDASQLSLCEELQAKFDLGFSKGFSFWGGGGGGGRARVQGLGFRA